MRGEFAQLASFLPEYPRTPHLPYCPNRTDDDLIADESETSFLFNSDTFIIEEKIDGSNCGMLLLDDNAVIRNREHILRKGYLKDTPAKMQFRNTWNWFYDNKEKFQVLNKLFDAEVGVYGEWCLALHGVVYNKLPEFFVPFDLFVKGIGFINSLEARNALQKAGFVCVPLLHSDKPVSDWEELKAMCEVQSSFGPEKREGIYIKNSNEKIVTSRFKMLRSDYVQGSKWNVDKITKQIVDKTARE